jgi:hypothetical protein
MIHDLGSMLFFMMALLVQVLTASQAPCSTAAECRTQTLEAIAAGEFERAHDLAWLAFQKGPKQDVAMMTLLARTQSLSGRGDDAYVMLRRLADARVIVEAVRDGKEFERVREHPRWAELLAAYDAILASTAQADKDDANPPKAAVEKPPSPRTDSRPAPEPPRAAEVKPAAPPEEVVVPAADDLAVPEPFRQPVAIAYDAVSARFVLGGRATDALSVLSQTSANVAPFTSRGWSERESTTALAIDRIAGDLWVAVSGALGSMLHRLQLISGRRLEIIELPGDPAAEVIALAIARDGLYALDHAGRRVLRRNGAARSLEIFAALPPELTATAMTRSPNAVYVAHTGGLLRIDIASRRHRAVSAADSNALSGLHSLHWHDGVLFAVRQVDERHEVVRLRVNAAGTAVTRLDVVGAAASVAATMSNGVYYYLTGASPDGPVTLRAITSK